MEEKIQRWGPFHHENQGRLEEETGNKQFRNGERFEYQGSEAKQVSQNQRVTPESYWFCTLIMEASFLDN